MSTEQATHRYVRAVANTTAREQVLKAFDTAVKDVRLDKLSREIRAARRRKQEWEALWD